MVLDNTILNVALPTIQTDLGADQSQLRLGGRLLHPRVRRAAVHLGRARRQVRPQADPHHRPRRSSPSPPRACAFATTPTMLIVFRGLMGIGGAAVLPGDPRDHHRGLPAARARQGDRRLGRRRRRRRGARPGARRPAAREPAVDRAGSPATTGARVFLINVPIVIVGLIGIFIVVPETKNPHPQRARHPRPRCISFTGLVLFVYGIIHALADAHVPHAVGAGSRWSSASLVLTLFVVTEARSDHRSFDVTLFKNRGLRRQPDRRHAGVLRDERASRSPCRSSCRRCAATPRCRPACASCRSRSARSSPRRAAPGWSNRFGYKRVMTFGLVARRAVAADRCRSRCTSTRRCGSSSSCSSSSASAWAT